MSIVSFSADISVEPLCLRSPRPAVNILFATNAAIRVRRASVGNALEGHPHDSLQGRVRCGGCHSILRIHFGRLSFTHVAISRLDTVSCMIESGRYNRVIIIGADKMSSMVDYKDRATCPLFGDGAGAVLVEATEEEVGLMDSHFRTDGKGLPFLHLKAGGSVCPASHFTVDHRLHYLYQEGRTVFRYAVTNMSDDSVLIAERNGLNKDNIDWVVPHQANMRIIEAVAKRLEIPMEKVIVNIEHYGNTSAGTIPLALWDYESRLRKGDNMIFTAFGAGFVHGALYLKWGYDGQTVTAQAK